MELLDQIGLHAGGDLQLPRADAQLQIHFLQLALRSLRLRAHIAKAGPQLGNLTANTIEVGVARGLRMSECDREQRDDHDSKRFLTRM